mgnify:CR=1 FL=1
MIISKIITTCRILNIVIRNKFITALVLFVKSIIQGVSFMVMIDCDPINGGMSINPDFMVNFGNEPNGPSRCHEMRYPGGDCTSDIWL